MTKHDRIISSLERRLIESGFETYKNIDYSFLGKQGEMDLYAISRKYDALFLIEVKTSDNTKNRRKAKHQIAKDKNYLSFLYPELNKFYFYAYGERGRQGYSVKRIK